MTVIKRYSNRKLYDTAAAEYVTIEQLGERIHSGEDISVIDHATGADLTAVTLMQVMFEREKKVGGMLPKAILTSLIQAGNIAVDTLRSGLSSTLRDPAAVEAEIRRRLKVLTADGLLAAEDLQRLSDLMLSSRWRQTEGSEAQPKSTTETGTAKPEEVETLLKQVDDLERQIEELKAKKASV